jgi:cbb3-type cytochrome oxidase subunit 1
VLVLVGGLIMLYNVVMTIRGADQARMVAAPAQA